MIPEIPLISYYFKEKCKGKRKNIFRNTNKNWNIHIYSKYKKHIFNATYLIYKNNHQITH